jgi:OOP family OmpA-OmpF porin
MKKFKFIFLIIALLTFNDLIAQKYENWTVGVGVNIIDNDGNVKKDLFNSRKSWNSLNCPSVFLVGYKLNELVSFEFSESFNAFDKGKTINAEKIKSPQFFSSTMIKGVLHPNAFFDTGRFDTYINGGFGITTIHRNVLLQPNLGLGLNYFVADGVALGLQASAFFGVTQVKNNFLMYSITLKSSLSKL